MEEQKYKKIIEFFHNLKLILGTDLIPGFACFLGCLFYELEMGIGLGVVIQVIMLLYHAARPGVEVQVKKVNISVKYIV